jgi:hypothetical protein
MALVQGEGMIFYYFKAIEGQMGYFPRYSSVPHDCQVKDASTLYNQSGFGVNRRAAPGIGFHYILSYSQSFPPTTRIWDKQGLSVVGLVELRRPRLAGKILAYPQSL